MIENIDSHSQTEDSGPHDSQLGPQGVVTAIRQDANGGDADPFVGMLIDESFRISVAEDEVICRVGDPPDSWWYVIDGFADVTSDGLYLATVGPGETIGEISMLDGRPRSARVIAKTAMRLVAGSADDFFAAVHASPEIALAVTRQMARRLRDLTERSVGTRPEPAVEPATDTPQRIADRPTTDGARQRVEFDPFAPGYFDDPSVQLGAIREQQAVHQVGLTGAYLLTRYADVHALARDRRLGVEIVHALPNSMIDAERAQLAAAPNTTASMFRRDGDPHTRVRRLVQRAFTPRAVAEWRIRTSQVADELLDAIAARGGGDLISDYALRLPVEIISDMLGMPTDMVPQLRGWSHRFTKTLDPLCTTDERDAAVAARTAMSEYLATVYDTKRTRPDDRIFSALIQAEDEGDRLSRGEVLANVALLYIAGHETTTNLIGNGIVELLRHPEQLDLLLANPDLDANLIEEVLRFNSPVQFTRRITSEDIVVAGTEIPAGSVVSLCAAAANRDPRKWGTTADQFIVDRVGANDHVAFGGGPHFCLGAALARMEGQIALPRVVRRFPRIQFTAEPNFEPRMTLRGVGTLAVTTS